MNSNKTNISSSRRYSLWITALLLTLTSAQDVRSQDFQEFTTNEQTIKDKSSYILRDENGWYMKAVLDSLNNSLALMSTQLKNEATPFLFDNWFSDYYFITVQAENNKTYYFSRNGYDVPRFTLGYIRDTEFFGWDCSSGGMSLSNIDHGWTTEHYLYCNDGKWEISTSKASTITMLESTIQDNSKNAGGSASGIEEIEEDKANHSIYTLSGTKVRGKPTKHGIYILDGRKIAY